jgi:hypothetical protein
MITGAAETGNWMPKKVSICLPSIELLSTYLMQKLKYNGPALTLTFEKKTFFA